MHPSHTRIELYVPSYTFFFLHYFLCTRSRNCFLTCPTSYSLRLLLGLNVRIDEELSKENEKAQNVPEVHRGDAERQLVAAIDHEVRRLAHHQGELDELERGQAR